MIDPKLIEKENPENQGNTLKDKQKKLSKALNIILLGILIIVIVSLISLLLPQKETDVALVTIKDFLYHNESVYGKFINARKLSNWAEGERREVITTKATYVFYLKDNTVVGISIKRPDGGLEKIL